MDSWFTHAYTSLIILHVWMSLRRSNTLDRADTTHNRCRMHCCALLQAWVFQGGLVFVLAWILTSAGAACTGRVGRGGWSNVLCLSHWLPWGCFPICRLFSWCKWHWCWASDWVSGSVDCGLTATPPRCPPCCPVLTLSLIWYGPLLSVYCLCYRTNAGLCGINTRFQPLIGILSKNQIGIRMVSQMDKQQGMYMPERDGSKLSHAYSWFHVRYFKI